MVLAWGAGPRRLSLVCFGSVISPGGRTLVAEARALEGQEGEREGGVNQLSAKDPP